MIDSYFQENSAVVEDRFYFVDMSGQEIKAVMFRPKSKLELRDGSSGLAGKQWRAERQACRCTRLTACFSQTVKPFWRLIWSIFARFPEFWDTINDSFSSTCANTYQHTTSYKEISVPMTCLDCKSLSLNSIVILVKQYTDHWTQYSLNRSCH